MTLSDPQAEKDFEAVFSDGETAAGRSVRIRLAAGGLEIRDETGTIVGSWPFDELTSSHPLEKGQPVNLGSSHLPGARIYIADPAAASAILPHAPHLSRKAERRRIFVPILIMLALIFGAAGALWVSGWSPSKAVAEYLPFEMRRAMGDRVVAFMTSNAKPCHAARADAALEKLFSRLRNAGGGKRPFRLQVADLAMMNAFAVPGETIVVSDELIKFVKSPEELAGVIAHEMGHGLELHPEAGLVRAMGMETLLNLFSGGTSGNMGNLGALMVQLSFSRDAEREADAHALRILRRAELPAEPFASFFARLQDRGDRPGKNGRSGKTAKNGKGEKPPDRKGKDDESLAVRLERLDRALRLLSTHPPLPERIETIRKMPPWPTRPLMSKAEWRALRHICDGGAGKEKPGGKDKKEKDSPG